MNPVDINGVIKGMLSLYGEPLFSSRGITVDMALDPSPTSVPGDRDSLKQILLNLWKNGAEAMPGGGRFIISTHNNVILAGRSHVEIRLSDSGPGLPAEVMERLFKPLEPNRRPGHAGIGLSIVATLVESFDGLITCQSNAGQGTSFIIQLPRTRVVEK
jgi:signal transduction histidine kinase